MFEVAGQSEANGRERAFHPAAPAVGPKRMEPIDRLLQCEYWEIRQPAPRFFHANATVFRVVVPEGGIPDTYLIQDSSDKVTYNDLVHAQIEPNRRAKLVSVIDPCFEIVIWENEKTGRGRDQVFGWYASSRDVNDATGVWLAEGQAPPHQPPPGKA